MTYPLSEQDRTARIAEHKAEYRMCRKLMLEFEARSGELKRILETVYGEEVRG